jgi:RNA polymerase sigma-70 factor (ECF subfamily)
MTRHESHIEQLLERAAGGDAAACQELLVCHRQRLKQMVIVRMDRRLAARLDPSDVVQEVLTEAFQKMSDFLRKRPLPFYGWLRQLAWERLVKLQERHIRAQKRSVMRETNLNAILSDESSMALAERLLARSGSVSKRLLQAELRARLQAGLADLSERDREILVMRYLEQLSVRDMAGVLGISEGAVKVRHLRALQRLRGLLEKDHGRTDR